MYFYNLEFKNEIIKFMKTNFNINVENYSEEKLRKLIINLTKLLEEKIAKERLNGFKLIQQLMESKMIMILEVNNK